MRVLRGCAVESGIEPLEDGAPDSASLSLKIARARRITSDSGMKVRSRISSFGIARQ
jgi:hypothetical protein